MVPDGRSKPNEPRFSLRTHGSLSKSSPLELLKGNKRVQQRHSWEKRASLLLHRLVWPALAKSQPVPAPPQLLLFLGNQDGSHLKLLQKEYLVHGVCRYFFFTYFENMRQGLYKPKSCNYHLILCSDNN
jgi:hypothetical protein